MRQVAARPVWEDHMTRNLVFDGDNVFLHGAVSCLRSFFLFIGMFVEPKSPLFRGSYVLCDLCTSAISANCR